MGADFFFCTFAFCMTTRRTLAVQALLVVGLLSAGLHAQNVGIGTSSPHPSARLHIEDNARGLLIPNVALTATNVAAPVTGPATSLLVYNTNTSGSGPTAVSPGFYYWDGNRSQWVRLLGGGEAWLLTGNAGTNPATNFLGTTDAQPLCIRVDNQETFRFNPPGASAPAWSIQRGGGDPRGLHAVDLQSARAQATQVASGNYSVISGGWRNTASGYIATVGGGNKNTASGSGSTVGGGEYNIASGVDATIGGGYQNTVTVDSWIGTIGGGEFNTVSGWWATVGGGYTNTASGLIATVGGGAFNTASGSLATVGGGNQNTVSGGWATVGGGNENTASGLVATVGGGERNIASGNFSVVPGGYSNTANANYNLVFGDNVDPSVTETHRVYFFGDGSNSNPSGFLVINRLDGDHPIHVGTTGGGNGNGAYLTAGGVWTNGSSRSFKERFVRYRPAEVLEKILQLPVEGYFYKGTEEYHITPMAEDFYRLFGTGVHEIIETDSTGQLVRRPNPDVDKYLAASDVAGVALLGIQALHAENAQLRQQVSDMRMEDAQLRQRVADLERENAALRARLEQLETLMQKIASTQTNP
jgi:hypothetical protein